MQGCREDRVKKDRVLDERKRRDMAVFTGEGRAFLERIDQTKSIRGSPYTRPQKLTARSK